MAAVERTEVFDVPAEKIYQVLIDYASYPDFVDGVTSIEIHHQDEAGAKVTYNLSLIKTFSYTIDLKHELNQSVSWSLVDGDFFSSNNGSWTLRDQGDGTTEVTYTLDVDFKVKVPGLISKKLTKSNLPSMMKSVHQRAKGH
jgi:coenzyme Q-binding protein COQ10